MAIEKTTLMTRGLAIIGSLGIALLFTACTDSDTSPPATMTKPKSHGTPSTATTAPPAGGTGTSSAVPTPTSISGANVATDGALSSFTDIAVRAGLQIQYLQVVQGLVSVSKYFCSSADPLNTDTGNGDMTFTIDDVDPPGQSTGDSFSVVLNQCVYYGQTYDGASVFKIDEISGTPYSPTPAPWRVATSHTADLTMTSAVATQTLKTAFGFSSGTADGVAFVRNISGSLESIAGTSTFKSSFDNKRNWDINANTFTQSVNTAFAGSFGEYTLLTLQPVSGTLGQAPSAGQARITLNIPGAIMMITTYTVLGNGNVKVEADSNGDGTVDSVTELPWDASGAAGYFG